MAKSELFTEHGRVFAWLLKKLGVFPVERNSADRFALKRAEELLESGCAVGIFPQGRIVSDETRFKAKSGAAFLALRTGVPLIPVSIYFEGKLRLFKKITVRIGKPIEVGKKSGACVRESLALSKRLSEAVEALLEVKHENNFGEVGGILFRSEQSGYDGK